MYNMIHLLTLLYIIYESKYWAFWSQAKKFFSLIYIYEMLDVY